MKLEEAKKNKPLQNVFKLNLNEISRGRYKPEEQKVNYRILNCFTKHEKLLLNYLMIVLQLHLRQNIKQFMEKDVSFTYIRLKFVSQNINS